MTKQKNKKISATATAIAKKEEGKEKVAGVPSINLRTKYYSILPLHLLFIHFSIYYLPSKILLSSQEDGGRPSGIGMTLDHLNQHPIRSLVLINLAVLLVQLWFTNFLRSWRNSLSSSSSSSTEKPVEKNDKLVKDLKTLFVKLIHTSPSDLPKKLAQEIDPKLGSLINRFILVIKEVVFINLIILLSITSILVLLGASITPMRYVLKTIGLSSFISLLSFFPGSILIGWNQGRSKPNWIRIYSSFQLSSEISSRHFFLYLSMCKN
ncbi:hypothetical protein Pst134EA_015083 [Puccinia striiformis f. sp. tritici]|uniref:hypothetical protein n=1 Tax=Puccinia striiformis f. sp. tritici TaxID=168172 RepID=UPI002008CE5A|nr:hypothetical protein Pst134EA_015083 [Puccinia striiformis f. sp. tritici]KAH9462994.1 hypothetical protein Pst134EA_015083 [Puccinia striiformis f. sp. tritici]